jgi:hypothetical protein
MTDDELERALVALPLEEPPAELRGRILGATIYRPRLNVRAWEVWAVGTVVAVAVWLSAVVLTGVPNAGGRIIAGVANLVPAFERAATSSTALWLAVGIATAVWLSQLSLPQPQRRTVES